MKQNYILRGALVLGAAALMGMANAGEWVSLNNEVLKSAAYVPGWSGALTKTSLPDTDPANIVAECYNSAFELYQEVNNLPAGKYTLTVSAFYRNTNNADAQTQMAGGANHNAVIYINSASTPVEGLFDTTAETYPNSMEEADEAFKAGRYLNTVEYTLAAPGTIKVGIKNVGGHQDEWCCFDNFKLVGPEGEVALVNGDFSDPMPYKIKDSGEHELLTSGGDWEFTNIANSKKSVDTNRTGATYRKCNASPFNIGQLVELPAGKYRFSVQGFLRHGGSGNVAGKWLSCKGGPMTWNEEESPLDKHNAGTENPEHNAYIYVSTAVDPEDESVKPLDEADAEFVEGSVYLKTALKCIFDEELAVYPDNEPTNQEILGQSEEGWDIWSTDENGYGWEDSGYEYQAAKCFVNNPDAYRNYVEFTLPAASKVWVGLKKDVNAPSQYWCTWRDLKLEVYDENAGIEAIAADNTNAPVEYYNLQGVRVIEPANGIYIRKQGTSVSKVIL